MSILCKPYEISLWRDEWDGNQYVEKRMMTIGSNEMEAQCRALEPKLIRKTNGEVSFSFKMYYQYIDNITGEKTHNPFVDYITNESKIKLHYDNEWFDLLVKNISEDSSNFSYIYTLSDQYVNELSKNGYDLTLDSSLMNNMGTIEKLGNIILADTDWEISENSEKIVQTEDEALVMFKIGGNLVAYQIDENNLALNGAPVKTKSVTIPANSLIYVFYSCCSGSKPYRFQFLYKEGGFTELDKDNDRIITTPNCQYCIDGLSYKPNGIYQVPTVVTFNPTQPEIDNGNSSNISQLYRGRRYVYGHESTFHTGLNRYVFQYQDENNDNYFGYTETKYITPNIIQSYVTNSEFLDTSGWRSSTKGDEELVSSYNPKLTACAIRLNQNKVVNALDDFFDGEFKNGHAYTSCLKCENLNIITSQDGDSVKTTKRFLINNGPYDMRQQIEGFTLGEKYVLELELYRVKDNTVQTDDSADPNDIRKTKGNFRFSTNENSNDIIFSTDFTATASVSGKKYQRVAITTYSKVSISKEDFLKKSYRLFLTFDNLADNEEIYITKFRFYKFFSNGKQNGYYTPDDQINEENVTYVEIQKYFPAGADWKSNLTIDEKQLTFSQPAGAIKPVLSKYAAKRSSVNIKESNYFNGIQTLAETFKCWPHIQVQHNANGEVEKKTICFKNYVGQPNFVGFKYGINEKNIKRTIDSKQIVSKLIVKANSNEFAPNGFCTIASATSNYTKDNVLYNFDYYLQQGLLEDAAQLQSNLYQIDEIGEGSEWKRLENWLNNNDTNNVIEIDSDGYYPKLNLINAKSEQVSNLLQEKATPLAQATAAYNVNKAGFESTNEQLNKAINNFNSLAGFGYDEISTDEQKEAVNKSSSLLGYLTEIRQLMTEKTKYTTQYGLASTNKTKLEEQYNKLVKKQTQIRELKKQLNQKFYSLYARYIQEGTWIDESYVDSNLYYIDAQSVLYNSAMPKISYTLNVITLAGIPGYENIDFKIGDQTFIEDVEFFGYAEDGSPYRELITVTETTENLDDPSKNSIKIQNYENQFQDLFKRITATVQSVKYTEGSYQKAAALAEANTARKISYLTDALTDAATVLSNAGNQTWSLDENGLTIDDPARGEGLRAIGGAILLKQKDEEGNDKWVTGMTSKGVSADLLTAGRVDTGKIHIMNGGQPTFRWDDHGISAYNFKDNEGIITQDKFKGVRFDRFGLYGYQGIDGETWQPKSINGQDDVGTIEDYSTFYLTWEGLKVKNSQGYALRIGDGAKSSKIIDEDGNEVSTDTTMLRVTNNEGNTVFAIENNGSLIWSADSSPTKALYSTHQQSKPNKTIWDNALDSAPDNSPTDWHKVQQNGDWYVSYSYDGGESWTSAIKIVSSDVQEVHEYYYASTSDNLNDIPAIGTSDWKPTPLNAGHNAVNKYLWNYESIKLTNGDTRYTDRVLISTQPKEIKDIYEFYRVLNTSTVEAGTLPTISFSKGTETIDSKGWTYSKNGMFDGDNKGVPIADKNNKYCWNYEIITYTDNSISIAGPSIIGSVGLDAYLISLSNSFDSIVRNNAGTIISNLPSVEVYTYYGDTKVSEGIIEIGAPSTDWIKDIHYSWSGSILKINSIPNNFKEGAFTFEWNNGATNASKSIYGTTKFVLKTINSTIDYDLLIDKTVINSSQGINPFQLKVLKKSEEGTTVLYGPEIPTNPEIIIYCGNEEVGVDTDNHWEKQTYIQEQTTPITYILKTIYDEGQGVEIVWDEQVVEFTRDGAGVKQILIGKQDSEKTYNDWIKFISPKEGETEKQQTLTIGNVSEFKKGDTAFLVGKVTDRMAGDDDQTYQSITVYGTVTAYDTANKTITITIISTVWGATKGTSPYSIELSNDNATIGTNSSGVYDKLVLPDVSKTTVTVFEGTTNINESCAFEWSVTGGTLNASTGDTIYFTSLSQDTAKATVTIKLKNTNQTPIGTKDFVISKVRQGEETITCYIESSMGNLFEKSQGGTTELTARIFKGSTEVNRDGTNFTYKWYKNGTQIPEKTTRKITMNIQDLLNVNIHFEAAEQLPTS